MSTILNTEQGTPLQIPRPLKGDKFRCAIIVARWNKTITEALLQGALDTFAQAGLKPRTNIDVYGVPGTVELVNAAARAMHTEAYDAIIVIGCVIRGDTPHFDYVCNIAADGVRELNCRGRQPIIFGVLTVENVGQACERAGGSLGNKGSEAAVAAIEMANLDFTPV